MSKTNKQLKMYVTSIIEDIQTRFVNEKTLKYSERRIERVYEFEDGAEVKYEWQSAPGKAADQDYNHRFSLVKPPMPNPEKLKNGVIKVIEFGNKAR